LKQSSNKKTIIAQLHSACLHGNQTTVGSESLRIPRKTCA